ncbi:MAG: hypothetical protein AUK34_01840 [Ignavibacteria bacterium CG2_30_36_16]|nr:MAG: hypothetical protein AUK34_01840 [Ignavibacteria bacterium CG2_30_36_16]PJB00790.1 MAG: hypothetical protein CO127_07080 [Ignavibacteria bacterium CG_4_9_14_3_um_filter_36_18]
MKKTVKEKPGQINDLKEEYHFDYSKAKKNPYAKNLRGEQVLFPIDNDIVKVLKTPERVNKVLKAIIGAYSQ